MIFSGATGLQVTKFHDFSWFLHSDTNSSPCSQSYLPGQTPIWSSTYPESIWYQDYRATRGNEPGLRPGKSREVPAFSLFLDITSVKIFSIENKTNF